MPKTKKKNGKSVIKRPTIKKLSNVSKVHKEVDVWLSLPKLHKDTIAEYIKRAKQSGATQINFVFGTTTQVSFSITGLNGGK